MSELLENCLNELLRFWTGWKMNTFNAVLCAAVYFRLHVLLQTRCTQSADHVLSISCPAHTQVCAVPPEHNQRSYIWLYIESLT